MTTTTPSGPPPAATGRHLTGWDRLPLGELRLPRDFTWGVAAAAYQIEGGATADGRRPSIWDTFSRVPGAVLDGDTGDVACDHYHRMPQDVALMAEYGVTSYRFSVSWARVCPDGGPVNPQGLAFYDRLVDALLEHGIDPWLTLYHWDVPQTLEDRGGWLARETADRFVDYASATYAVLGDRVPTWTTLNEPWCSAFLGYTAGIHAPGRQEGVAGLVATHHLLLAHGLGVAALREQGAQRVGITLNHTVADPLDPGDPADVDAARRIDALHNRVFLDPLFRGAYPADLVADTAHLTWSGRAWTDVVRDGDLALISAPLDALGVNYYHGDAVSGHPRTPVDDGVRKAPRPVSSPFVSAEHVSVVPRGLPVTGIGWEVQPEGLYRLLRRLHDDYAPPPMWVTETGAAYPDEPGPDGRVEDPERIRYLDGHLRAAYLAHEEGVDVRGIYWWSLLDNFEWAYGYSQRFGLVHVDYATLERTPKASLRWLSGVASSGVLPPAESLA